MSALRFTTWNLLHRVHAENWEATIPARHPDEALRIQALSARIAALTEGSALVGLQEVSGDQLASLRSALHGKAELLSYRYPRRPRPRRGLRHRATLEDPSEHLVLVIAGSRPVHPVEAAAFADDPGKGLLAVDVGGLLVINCHVSYGKRSQGQLARLGRLAHHHRGSVVLLGDFNADRETVRAGLEGGEGLAFARAPEGSLPTRPRHRGPKSDVIDHVIVRGGRPGTATVVDAAGLSDHNAVTVEVALASG